MKKLLLLFISVNTIFLPVSAQQKTTAFEVEGIKVIFKPTVKNVISVRLFYRGGVANYLADNAGIEEFALKAAVDCGTQKYTANAYRDKTDKYGVVISAASDLIMEIYLWNVFRNILMKAGTFSARP